MLCRKYTGVEEIIPNLTSQGKPCGRGIYVKILQTGHVSGIWEDNYQQEAWGQVYAAIFVLEDKAA